MLDSTELCVSILGAALDVPVSTDVPESRPTRFVLVDLSGYQFDGFIHDARYMLTCWGSSDRDAKGIAFSAVQALQEASETHPYLSACFLETMSREEWSKTGQSRYLVEVDLIINTDE